MNTDYQSACKSIRADAAANDLKQATLDDARYYEGAVNPNGTIQGRKARLQDAQQVYDAYLEGDYG